MHTNIDEGIDTEINAEEAQRVSNHYLEMGTLLCWTVFEHPRDYPDSFICRPSFPRGGEPIPAKVFLRAATLALLREKIPHSLTPFDRHPSDHPNMIETWI